jgi:cell division protein FtsQ
MVAVVRGERSAPSARARSASSARARRPSGREPKVPARPKKIEHAGLAPRLALAIGALVIVGGALAGTVMARHDHAPAVRPALPTPEHASPLARLFVPLGFRLTRVEVQGAPEMARADILRAAGLAKDAPILDVRLDDLRQRVEATGWVQDAKIVRLLPDTLIIAVTPRTAAAVWQHEGVLKVVDTEGRLIGGADPARFPALPLVVGEGAAEEAKNILPLLRQRPALLAKVDALVRVDGRRWDLRLKDGSLIQLPAIGADSALIQLDQLDQKQRLLSLGFERIDLRDPDEVVVRPRPAGEPAKN